METKKVTMPCQLIAKGNNTIFKLQPTKFEKVDVAFHVCTDAEQSVFYDRGTEGCLMVQEMWIDELHKIYFGINTKGELIAVFPKGYDGEINENGELIVAKAE